MTAYVKLTNFAAKDNLLSGNPLKVVTGAELDDEFNAIAASSALNYTSLNNAVDASFIKWNFSTTTTMADPGSGILRFNNATASSVTAIAVDDLNSDGNDVSAYVASWDDSTGSTNRGTLMLRQSSSVFAIFSVTGLTDNSGWTQLAVTYVTGSGTFVDGTETYVSFYRTGEASADVSTVAGIAANVTTVAGIAADVTTVATNNANVTAVASNATNINAVASDLLEPVSEINTVATDIANVNTVAGISANVTAVAGNSANINAVAGNATNINAVAADATDIGIVAAANTNIGTVATNISSVNTAATNIAAIIAAPTEASNAAASASAAAASYDSFDDRYLGSKVADPTLDNDGNALITGALYWNSVAGEMRVYSGSAWVAAYLPGSAYATKTQTISNKTGAYTVVAGDNSTIINCTSGTFTVALTAAATLGVGFNCEIINTSTTSTDVITIDPSGAETIDNGTTATLYRGMSIKLLCTGTGWEIVGKSARAFASNTSDSSYPVASGLLSLSIGVGTASGQNSYCIAGSPLATASGTNSLVLAASGTSVASGVNSAAIGNSTTSGADRSMAIAMNSSANGSVTATGAGAMALGGSYASGADSFAAAIANNTSSYGSTGANSASIGQLGKASGANAVNLGNNGISDGIDSVTIGNGANAWGIRGRFALGGNGQDYQSGKLILRKQTTDATPTVITSGGGSASTTNQVILPNDSTYAFTILVVARRTDADNESAGYEFKGVVDRNGSAATTALVGSVTKTVLAEDTAAWDCNVTADTTNGGLAITVTGEAAKTIRWVATCWTSEVTG